MPEDSPTTGYALMNGVGLTNMFAGLLDQLADRRRVVHRQGPGRSEARLTILPGRTNYDVFDSPQLAAIVADFIA